MLRDGAEARQAIFPTFFMAGFECSTFVWKDGKRKDYVAATGHDVHLKADLAAAMDLGIGVVREGIRWPSVDLGNGNYDWSSVKAVQDAATACKITPIWDLCHYGFPDGCDPFSQECLNRFADYCRGVAKFVTTTAEGPFFFTPMNEITFFSAAASDLEWMYPFVKGRENELKRALARMAIEGAKAIREIEPDARMVHVDPIVHAVPPANRPDLAEEAWDEEHRKAMEGWDMLSGRVAPELGGSPRLRYRRRECLPLQPSPAQRRQKAGSAWTARSAPEAVERTAQTSVGSLSPADHHRRDERVPGEPSRMAADDNGRIIESA